VLTLTSCPQCGAPAEITERFLLASTDGPVPHVALACAAGHHFRMAAEGLPGSERSGTEPVAMLGSPGQALRTSGELRM
jgi:hypothetical protein